MFPTAKYQKILLFISLLYAFIFLFYHQFYFYRETKLGIDTVSWVLPAVAPDLKIGVPYKDYFEIHPPGIFIVTFLWAKILGFSLASIKLFHFLLGLFISLFFIKILFKLFKPTLAFLITISSMPVFFSNRLITYLLPAEMYGLIFSLAGIFILIGNIKAERKIFLSVCLFFLSSQMKDPFIYGLIAVIPVLLREMARHKDKIKEILASFMSGIILPVLAIMLYLGLLGVMKEYWEVLRYKNSVYSVLDPESIFYTTYSIFQYFQNAKNTFIYLQYNTLWLIIFFFIILLIKKVKDKSLIVNNQKMIFNLNLSDNQTNKIALLLYVFGMLIGFAYQKRLDTHYQLLVIFPVFLFIGFIFNEIIISLDLLRKKKILYIIGLFAIYAILFLAVMPKKNYLVEYQFNNNPLKLLSEIKETNSPNTLLENQIKANTKPEDCILKVYGWDAGQLYLYSERKPCTRYFLPNLMKYEYKIDEYRSDLVSNPPKVVYYTQANADLNIKRFEDQVFNYTLVLQNCYKEDNIFPELSWAMYPKDEQSKCLRKFGY
jgi:hypothetical protein